MIQIIDKYKCCGCSACVQSCPKQCISFDEDEQGFCYPLVNQEVCIECGLCEKVCPCLNQTEPQIPKKVFAAINPNEEIRLKSSSGGVFTMLAEAVLDDGGIVFGASFDKNWEVVHDYTETIEGLESFRGSKYVQSRIGENYKLVRKFLKEGRKVLFSGTSCQIAGLKTFLRKDYDNLLTVDVVCHGVPSPKVWREYLAQNHNVSELKSISMKDKSSGWREYSYTFTNKNGCYSELASKNKFQHGFLQNITLRQSCFNCPAKAGKSQSDITLADYWGVESLVPDMDDYKGISFVCANTNKGIELLNSIDLISKETDYKSSVPYNLCIVKSTLEPENYTEFWNHFKEDGINTLMSLKTRHGNLLKRILKRLFRKV